MQRVRALSKLVLMMTTLSFSLVLSAVQAESGLDNRQLEELLAVKLNLEAASLDGVRLNRGGGYDVLHSKWELGNFLASLSHESFDVNWRDQQNLPFASGHPRPVSRVQRYHLKAHVPYRINEQSLWLLHLGAEWAFEKETDDALSVQSYLLYSKKWDPLNSWQLGVYVNHHPVQTVMLPIVEYTHNFQSPLRQGVYGHLGFPKTQLGLHLSERLRTEVGLVYHQAIIQLAKNSPIESAGYFQSKNWRADWSTFYRLTPKLEVHLGAQLSVSNVLISYGSDYRETDHVYGNEGLGVKLGVSYIF